jgi:hypothetical protein
MSNYSEEVAAIRAARIALDGERDGLYALQLKRQDLQRRQRRFERGERPQLQAAQEAAGNVLPRGDARQALAQTEADLDGKRRSVKEHERGVRDRIDGLFRQRSPQELIGVWGDETPILLLPVRIETRFKPGELWVRVFPDDIAVNTHEKVLTAAEGQFGRAYWQALGTAADEKARDEAWRVLAKRLGANRAAWVALQMKPRNWDEAALPGQHEPPDFPDQELTKPDSWTVAPHTRVMPDRFVLLAYQGDDLVLSAVGNQIDDIVVLGPAPLQEDDGTPSITRGPDRALQFGDAFGWVADFDAAVARGMGFKVPVSAEQAASGFSQLIVLGLKLSADADDGKRLVEELIDNHHYSKEGFALVRQGTATNNTEETDSGFTQSDDVEGSAVTEAGKALFTPQANRAGASDGQRLADYLGIDYGPLLHVGNADSTDYSEAVAMNRALYAGTLGYFLYSMLNEVLSNDAIRAVRAHFTDYVTGRGPLPAIRVGNQPYGILLTSAFDRWTVAQSRFLRFPAGVSAAAFEQTFHRILVRFERAWQTRIGALAQIGRADGAEPAQQLLDVLGLHPTSVDYFQRVGYSFDTLVNVSGLAWGGAAFEDALKLSTEKSMTRQLLRDLGNQETLPGGKTKPIPLLLQLIWRHYHTHLDSLKLIDGAPLSETRTLQPYDAVGKLNYIDWLIANATNVEKLEGLDFGGATVPGALLFLLLQNSLLQETRLGIHTYLGQNGVTAEELIRSRKFMNMSTEPSISAWEVFRAPVNRIVESEAATTSLYEFVHSPQFRLGPLSEIGADIGVFLDALTTLRGMPTARLERVLAEHIDTLSYRLDAWLTSLFDLRLSQQRRLDQDPQQRRTGVFVGAYGYLENVRAEPRQRVQVSEQELPEPLRGGHENLFREVGNGGYVHTPSLNHAAAAALLRSGYLSHATKERREALATNLSSERVRRARYLIDGVRNGQSLETLLGVQFERGLHDWTTRNPGPVILDDLKPAFRAAYPIRRSRIPQAADGPGEPQIVEDFSVVNGLDLAQTKVAWPWGVPELAALTQDKVDALQTEKRNIENTLDALRDVLTAESAYQLALGNFDRAAAVLQSAAGGQLPPEIEVIQSSRGTGAALTNRLIVQFDPLLATNPWPAPLTPRTRVEPAINCWVAGLLGEPANIRCHVSVIDAGGPAVDGVVSLADLQTPALDFIYGVRNVVQETAASELESRVRYVFARARGLADDVVVRITFSDSGSGDPGVRSFAEVLPLADRVRRLLGAAKPLDARQFISASIAKPDAVNPGRIETAELLARVQTLLASMSALFVALTTAADAVRALATQLTADALRARLVAIANCGMADALPRSAVGHDAAQVNVLLTQADALNGRFAATLAAAAPVLTRAANAATAADQSVSLLRQVAQSVLNADFNMLPQFTYGDVTELSNAAGSSDQLLHHARDVMNIPLPVEEWLHGAALVRTPVHGFEMLRVMADTLNPEPLRLAAMQLPFLAEDSWLAVDFPPGTEVLHDTISIVQHCPQGFRAAGVQIGLLIDEWVESVPNRSEMTGIAFNFDQPDSAPPQSLLLVVPPEQTGHWRWDDLVGAVRDTFARARLRAVEPDAVGDLSGIGTLLPAVMAEFSTGAGTVSLDYTFVFESVRAGVTQMRATTLRGGGG